VRENCVSHRIFAVHELFSGAVNLRSQSGLAQVKTLSETIWPMRTGHLLQPKLDIVG
jgi:hypothetical protein